MRGSFREYLFELERKFSHMLTFVFCFCKWIATLNFFNKLLTIYSKQFPSASALQRKNYLKIDFCDVFNATFFIKFVNRCLYYSLVHIHIYLALSFGPTSLFGIVILARCLFDRVIDHTGRRSKSQSAGNAGKDIFKVTF